MADDKDSIVYRFTPQFDGAYLRGVPQRDLTQRDVDAMTIDQRVDAFAPHPLHGTPLYTAVAGDGEPPKWFRDKLAKALSDGTAIPPMQPGETQRAYEARVAADEPPQTETDNEPPAEETAGNQGGEA